MKADWVEAFRYYKKHINFPRSNVKEWCKWYQNNCRFYLDETIEVKLTLIQKIFKRLFK